EAAEARLAPPLQPLIARLERFGPPSLQRFVGGGDVARIAFADIDLLLRSRRQRRKRHGGDGNKRHPFPAVEQPRHLAPCNRFLLSSLCYYLLQRTRSV